MKKKYNIFKILFLSTLSIYLILALTYLSKPEKNIFEFIGFKYAMSDERLSIISEKVLSLNNITEINFNLDVDDITFIDNSDEKIKIIEKSTNKLAENKTLQFNHKNNKIDIYRSSKLNINRLDKSFKREVIVYLPKSYNKNININISLGNIKFLSDLKLNKLEIYLNTGDININNSIKCKSFIIECNNGNTNISNLLSNEYGISFNTGNVYISNLSGKGYINTTIGNLTCNISDLTGNSDFSSSIGDIILNINKKLNFKINTSCDIGNIKTDFTENHIIKNSSNELNIDCGCGNIEINKSY